jgi:hypothetical protein
MEFFCVLSVSGSLASYHVQKESAVAYKAVLRPNNGKRDDIPAEIRLKKDGEGWQAAPWHDEIVRGLIHAIESNGQ